MILAGSFAGAVEVAEQNCSEWLLAGNGEVFHAGELHEVAKEFDAETPLGEDEFLVVTDDGSIGLLFPNLKEPEMYFVSPQWAVVNILKEDPRKYIVPGDGAAKGAGVYPQTYAAGTHTAGNVANSAQQSVATVAKVFCENCGAELRPGSRFCEHCGAKNAPEFCANCGTKLEGGSQFCGNCGVRV